MRSARTTAATAGGTTTGAAASAGATRTTSTKPEKFDQQSFERIQFFHPKAERPRFGKLGEQSIERGGSGREFRGLEYSGSCRTTRKDNTGGRVQCEFRVRYAR